MKSMSINGSINTKVLSIAIFSIILLSFFYYPTTVLSQYECPPNTGDWDCEPYQTFIDTVYLYGSVNAGWNFPQCPIEIVYGLSRCTDLITGQSFYQYWGPSFKIEQSDPRCRDLYAYLLDGNREYDNKKLRDLHIVLVSMMLINKFQEDPIPCPNLFAFTKSYASCYAFVKIKSTGQMMLVNCYGESLCCTSAFVCLDGYGEPSVTWKSEKSGSQMFCPQFPPPDDNYEYVTECDRFCENPLME